MFFLSFIAGGIITLSDPNGVITSQGFSNDYPSYSYISWLIKMPEGKFIEVNFLSFETDLKYCNDYLTIYDGASDASAVIGEFCGDEVPASFISSTNEILLVFKSECRRNHKGFQLEYKTSSKNF